jgi:hypothetical protein
LLATVLAASATSLASGAAYASAGARPVLSVGGEVTTPAAYTAAQLAALPQTTATVTVGGRPVTGTGVLLETLVTNAGPAYPASLLNTKNELLRVTVTVRGAGHRQVTFAVGELDAGFGNHPALLALTQNGHRIGHGPELVVPGDRAPVRFVPRVSRLTVGIATTPATDTNPAAGSPVEVIDGHHHVTLSAALLARLPAETLPSRSWDRAERRPTPRSARPCSRSWPRRGSSRRSARGSRPWASTITWPRSPRPSSWWAGDRYSCR